MPIGIFVLIMAITALSVFAIEQVEAERRRAQLREVSGAVASALMRRSIAHVTYLKAGAVLFSDGHKVTADAFRDFARDLEANEEFRSPDGISWVAQVPRDAIPAFEAARHAEGEPAFTIHPAPTPDRPFALPITYLGAADASKRFALGKDIFAEPARRPALEAAARTNRPVATGKLVVARPDGSGTWTGFILYMPVFAGEPGHRTLSGYISAPFEGHAFLGSALELEQTQGLGVRLYDGAITPDRLIAQVESSRRTDQSMARAVTIADHRFMLVVTALDTGMLSPLSSLTLLFGIMVASLLTIMARLLTSQAEEDRASLAWLREQASIRNLLTRELNHRVKNTLANVLSIIALTGRRATDLPSFLASLNGRIRALSATHDLLTDLEWGPAPLRAVVAMELAPYTAGRDHDIAIDGPDIQLAPNDALSLGLAIHELATNATKYGAFSVPTGRIAVTWEQLAADLARVSWVESGGPPVPQERRRGFGTDLIERIVAQELGGGVELRFDPDGVRCTLTVPIRRPAVFQIRAPKGG
ncbi:MAG: CHASE domain-containing protein [Sphingomonadales bacterium]|nr:CHASE domain-containing protein [Sphingomonadales bacterium]